MSAVVDLRVLGPADPSRNLLMSAALSPPSTALSSWQRWKERAVPPNDRVAARWLPLVSWNLRHEHLDAQTTTGLAASRRQAWSANAAIWTSAAPTLKRLDDHGIKWMLLKGAAVAWTTYADPSLRAIGDIDVLVHPENAARAHAILESEGWRSATGHGPGETDGAHGTNYVKPPRGALDLHAFALRENCHANADAGFWERSVTANISGMPVRLPCPGDLLLHVCVHGLRWNPVHSCHWVADAASIIGRAGRDLDWKLLVGESRRRDVTLQVHDALDLVRHVAAVEIPAAVFSDLMQPRPSWRARIERHVKTRPLYGPGGLLLMWFDWRRLRASHPQGDAIGFPDYLAASMRLPSKRAIVPAMTRHLIRRSVP